MAVIQPSNRIVGSKADWLSLMFRLLGHDALDIIQPGVTDLHVSTKSNWSTQEGHNVNLIYTIDPKYSLAEALGKILRGYAVRAESVQISTGGEVLVVTIRDREYEEALKPFVF